MQGTQKYDCKLQNWKAKAKLRSKELHQKNRRIKELTSSRDNWKRKYAQTKLALSSLQKTASDSNPKSILSSDRPKYHSYGSHIIMMCMLLRQCAHSSLRGSVEMLKIMCLILNLECRIPSKTTIQNWEKKLGYYRLNHSCQSGQWVVILDESISVGQEKLLLVLGVNLLDYSFEKAVCFEDVQLLDLAISTSWKGDLISETNFALARKRIEDRIWAERSGYQYS